MGRQSAILQYNSSSRGPHFVTRRVSEGSEVTRIEELVVQASRLPAAAGTAAPQIRRLPLNSSCSRAVPPCSSARLMGHPTPHAAREGRDEFPRRTNIFPRVARNAPSAQAHLLTALPRAGSLAERPKTTQRRHITVRFAPLSGDAGRHAEPREVRGASKACASSPIAISTTALACVPFAAFEVFLPYAQEP